MSRDSLSSHRMVQLLLAVALIPWFLTDPEPIPSMCGVPVIEHPDFTKRYCARHHGRGHRPS